MITPTMSAYCTVNLVYWNSSVLLMIDNYDSFTYNLVQYLGELNVEVRVVRNDEISLSDIERLNPDYIMISPGPCDPDKAGISMATIKSFAGVIPIFGVCLGYQSIAQVYGGRIVRAQRVMHGKVSPVHHIGVGVFSGLPSPFNATRYHSLVIDQATLPECLDVTAWTELDNGTREEIMGIKHKTLPIEGVQFHPESILSQHGHDMLRHFIEHYKTR